MFASEPHSPTDPGNIEILYMVKAFKWEHKEYCKNWLKGEQLISNDGFPNQSQMFNKFVGCLTAF